MPVPPLILASRSPRRLSLLREAGYDFTQTDPPFADPPTPPPQTSLLAPEVTAVQLAAAKARSLLTAMNQASRAEASSTPPIILAADTIVIAPDGSLMGQPTDRADAQRMLTALIGRTHRVVTGVALLDMNGVRGLAFVDVAVVSLGHVEPELLASYLDSGKWKGKAGAYNLAELERHWPFTVVGDPATVVGLPMVKLAAALAAWPDVAAALNAIHASAVGVI